MNNSLFFSSADRRKLVKWLAFGAFAAPHAGLAAALTKHAPDATIAPSLQGEIAAVTLLPFPKEGAPTAAVGLLNVATGHIQQIKLHMRAPHDVLAIDHERFLVLPNAKNCPAQLVHRSGEMQSIPLPEQMYFTGHAFYDRPRGIIYAAAGDLGDDKAGYFICIDPDTFNIIDTIPNRSRGPHDMLAIDDDTLAVCNYNKSVPGHPATQHATTPRDGWSYLSFYRRDDLSLISHQRAYKNAYVSHITQSNNGQIYGIGHYEYPFAKEDLANYSDAEKREKLRELLTQYTQKAQPELLPQVDRIAEEFSLHRVEKSVSEIGFPLLPLKTRREQAQASPVVLDPFVHRRAQSICHNAATDTVVMSFPNTDSVCLLNGQNGSATDLGKAQHGLKEVRGICEMHASPYVMLAGCHYGFALVNTHTMQVVQRYPEASLGRIIHMQHLA